MEGNEAANETAWTGAQNIGKYFRLVKTPITTCTKNLKNIGQVIQ